RRACDRLGVTHPVVNDRAYRIWRAYDVGAWPTIALIDPDGYLVGTQSGEFDVEDLAQAIERLLAERPAERAMGEPFFAGADADSLPAPEGPLRYPSRVVANSDTLWVSDTGNRRVVEVALDGGRAGHVTRAFSGSSGVRFVEPQGLARVGSLLYVADRGGHSVWRIDLETGSCERVAGTGRLGRGLLTEGPADTDLRSPWGLAARGEDLLVAIAGSHQIWRLDPERGVLIPAAGNGAEEILDGRAATAALAQPTGLALADSLAYFADCESSAVRRLDMSASVVNTIVGSGLFDFGDRDGRGEDVRLQHCLDLALVGQEIVVADTYNDKLKVVEPVTRECAAYAGDAGSGDSLCEPGGVFASGSQLLVADTGNHRIAIVDAKGRVEHIEIIEE
ncbi:MAG: alkyl hydroperoxide reductase, partial [Coriobacteriia bacterium]|nr:alkyl hydroperoxide reductase [Coriobacteriia bacterium]